MAAHPERSGAVTQAATSQVNGNGVAAALRRTFGPQAALRVHVRDEAGRLRATLTHGSWPEEADALSISRRRPAFEAAVDEEITLRGPEGTALLLLPMILKDETVGIVEIIAPRVAIAEHRAALPAFVESITTRYGPERHEEKRPGTNGSSRNRDARPADQYPGSNGGSGEMGAVNGSGLHGIRVLIVDKHKLFGEALRNVLEELGAGVLQPVEDTGEALSVARRALPNVVLIDLALNNGDAKELAGDIRRECPAARVIGLKAASEANGSELLRSGFHGLLTKDASLDLLIRSIRSALAGELVAPLAPSRWSPPVRTADERHATMLADHLTPRERVVLALLVEGRSGQEIAERLSASQNTIRTHIQSILAKLQVHSRLQAVAFAVRNGLVRVPRDGRRTDGVSLHPFDIGPLRRPGGELLQTRP